MIEYLIISIILGLSLSVDAFSLSIIYGTIGLEKGKINQISLIVGLYHFIMPIIGYYFGFIIKRIIIIEGNIFIAIIFIIIAIEMFFSIKDHQKQVELKSIYSLLLFGITVSIDSFIVGIGIKIIGDYIILKAIIFAVISCFSTYMGCKLGKRLKDNFGNKIIIIGGIILIILSFYYFIS